MVIRSPASADHQRLLRQYRLRKSAEFDLVFAQRCSVSDQQLILYARHNGHLHARLGLVVSRKVGHAAHRNRWKRLIRDAFRLERKALPAVDLVVIPRFKGDPQQGELRRSLRRLAQRAYRKLGPTP